MVDNHEACSPGSGLVFGLETNNLELVKQLLDEIAGATEEDSHAVASRLEEVTDFIDALRRHPQLPDNDRNALCEAGTAAMCELVRACDPSVLQERSSMLAPYLVDSLGHGLPGVSASLWLIWLADRRIAEQALREHGLTHGKASVRLASVLELERWVTAMNGNFAFRKFTPSVVSLLRDSDAGVRAAAYSLLVRFFAGTKQPARDDLINVMKRLQLNDMLQTKLLAAIGNFIKSEGPLNDALSRPSSAASTSSRSSGSSRGSMQQENPKPSPALVDTAPCSDRSVYLECLADPRYPMQPMSQLDKNIRSDSEFVFETSKLLPAFEGKETEHNWLSRQQAVNDYRKMLRSTVHTPSQAAVHDGFKLLQRAVCEVLSSMRTTLVIDTCQAIKDCCQLMAGSSLYYELFDPILDSLGKVATGIKKITAAAAHLTLCAVFIESPSSISSRQMGLILQESKNLKPHARAYAFYWLKVAVTTASVASLVHWQDDVESIVIKAVNDAAPAGRAQGRELYWILDGISRNITAKISRKLGPAAIKAVQADKPKSISGPVNVDRGAGEGEHEKSIDFVGTKESSPAILAPPSRLRSTSPPRSPTPSQSGPALIRAKIPPRLATGKAAGERPIGLGGSRQVSPHTPRHLGSQTPSRSSSRASSQGSQTSSRGSAETPNRRKADVDASIARSLADLSVEDIGVSDDSIGTPTPGTPKMRASSPLPPPRSSIASTSISLNPQDVKKESSLRYSSRADVGALLRKLSTADLPPEAIKSALRDIKASSSEVSSSAAIAKIIQIDVETSSRTQKEGYLRLLRLLDYETEEPSKNPEIERRPASTELGASETEAAQPLITFPYRSSASTPSKPREPSHIRKSVYVDEDSDSSASLESVSSVLSVASSVSGPSALLNSEKMATGSMIGPFASAYPECKAQINDMVNQVKQGTASIDCLAALAVLVTAASTAMGPVRSPIHTAVTVWRQHFTFDMELRDAILPFLDQGPAQLSVEQVVVGLLLLKVLLSSDAPHAAVYLDGSLCLKHLLSISGKFGSRSLEINNHLLPDICKLVMTLRADTLSASSALQLFMPAMAAELSDPKLLGLQAARQLLEVFSDELDDELQGLLSDMVFLAVRDRDVRVRREVFELLVTIHREHQALAEPVSQNLTASQRNLLTAMIEQRTN